MTDPSPTSENRPFMHSRYPVLLFDGVCNFCNDSVNFIIKHDKRGVIRFAALQSKSGQELLETFGYSGGQVSTVVVVADGAIYTKSDAALQVCKHLGGAWHLLRAFVIVPRPIRNAVYDWVARNRYRWFGRKEECMIPSADVRSRFLV